MNIKNTKNYSNQFELFKYKQQLSFEDLKIYIDYNDYKIIYAH